MIDKTTRFVVRLFLCLAILAMAILLMPTQHALVQSTPCGTTVEGGPWVNCYPLETPTSIPDVPPRIIVEYGSSVRQTVLEGSTLIPDAPSRIITEYGSSIRSATLEGSTLIPDTPSRIITEYGSSIRSATLEGSIAIPDTSPRVIAEYASSLRQSLLVPMIGNATGNDTGEIGLIVQIIPSAPEGYYVDKPLEFEVTVTNPSDTTGINVTAYNVQLAVVLPPEIETTSSSYYLGDLAPSEAKTHTFTASANAAGDNFEISANASGWDSILWKPIAGSEKCYVSIHDSSNPPSPTEWSFAVITDLHIGYGTSDYGAAGYADGNTGQSDSYTRKLDSAIQTILRNRDAYNIQFVVVSGDISDTAEESEFYKARDILTQLNDQNIPYIPIIGNHDTLPYTQLTDQPDRPNPWDAPGDNNIVAKAEYGGDKIFHRVFWDENPTNVQLISATFQGSWEEGPHPTQHRIGLKLEDLFIENYAFNFGLGNNTVSFLSLDFAERAYPPWYPVSSATTAVPMWEETQQFLESKLTDYDGKPLVVFSHFPLYGLGGFAQHQYLANVLVNKGYNANTAYDFAGHNHRNSEEIVNLLKWNWLRMDSDIVSSAYKIIETEAVSQIPTALMGWYSLNYPLVESTHSEQSIRIVKVKDGGILDYSTTLKPSTEIDILYPSPVIGYGPFASYPEPNEEITFTGYFTTYYGFQTSFQWDFGDGTTGLGSPVTHSYAGPGDYNVKLTATLKNLVTNGQTTQEETRTVYVRNKYAISLLPPDLYATSLLTDENFSQVPQNVYQLALITKKISEERVPIAGLGVRFEDATQDINLSGLTADVSIGDGKSVLYMSSWPSEIEQYKNLYIPSTGIGTVYICSNATALDEVTPDNADLIINVGETIDGITVETTVYNGREYYVVSGVTGTGGGELTGIELNLKAGWNMVSVPVVLGNNSVGAVFPGVAAVYTWNPTTKSYIAPTTVEAEKGYWVAATQDGNITITGVPVPTWTSDIKAGWNMIGSVINTASIADPNDEPNGCVQPFAYWWDPVLRRYILTTDIEPGKGYWVASVQDCTLAMP